MIDAFYSLAMLLRPDMRWRAWGIAKREWLIINLENEENQ